MATLSPSPSYQGLLPLVWAAPPALQDPVLRSSPCLCGDPRLPSIAIVCSEEEPQEELGQVEAVGPAA